MSYQAAVQDCAGGRLTAARGPAACARGPAPSTRDLCGIPHCAGAAARVRPEHALTGSFTAGAGTPPRTAEAKQGTSITSMEEA